MHPGPRIRQVCTLGSLQCSPVLSLRHCTTLLSLLPITETIFFCISRLPEEPPMRHIAFGFDRKIEDFYSHQAPAACTWSASTTGMDGFPTFVIQPVRRPHNLELSLSASASVLRRKSQTCSIHSARCMLSSPAESPMCHSAFGCVPGRFLPIYIQVKRAQRALVGCHRLPASQLFSNPRRTPT
jgi:hypothetical protein